jgi:AraC-like DNA-binding protein
MNPKNPIRRLWFENGFWWYFCPNRSIRFEITSLIRRANYRSREIAKRLGTCTRTLERLVQNSLDISLKTWLHWERAVRIQYRLSEGASVKELAVELGFSHQTNLTLEFRKWFGITPSKFRSIAKRLQSPT